MYVHRSNRTEALVEALAAVVGSPPADPFQPECIVVQGKGMERWLSMELARRLGVWANPDFPFPRRFVERALAAAFGEEPETEDPFRPEQLMWSIAALLPEHLERAEFAPIRTYLAGDERGIGLIQLAERIADTFDHYVVYRPQMVLGWEKGEGTDWQAVLWRRLVERHGSVHFAARARRFFALGEKAPRLAAGLARRASLFGVSTLPPVYVEILAALARVIEVHLFVLSPSREYWAEIRSRREIIRTLRARGADAVEADEQLHLDEGNPLLASLGRLGRDFQQVLEAAADYEEEELYTEPGTRTVLGALQSDILNLRRRGSRAENPAIPQPPGDRSIGIHACHGPMRQVEVLHDQLAALFDEDPALEPRDVVVMAPDIGTYAPLIEAVFRAGSGGRPFIPYSIADRRPPAAAEVSEALKRILAVVRGRMTACEVFDLLGIDAVRARFGIGAGDLDLVRQWVAEAGIRWGADAKHRKAEGQPGLAENTWRFGLDRLLLGYAMAGEERTLYGGVLPYDDVQGETAEVLGRVAEFCAALFRFHASLREPRPLAAWRDALGEVLEEMIASTEQNAPEHLRLRSALAALARRGGAAGFGAAVDLEAVRSRLEKETEGGISGRGFLSGGVTFCELVPMRTIPFRVVCLLGMDDGAFPRARHPLGFDLLAQRPMRGDRTARDDDRYLFLESLLSARERLLIFYVGQSINDNSEIPPSPVVSELLDTIDDSFASQTPGPSAAGTAPAGTAVRDRLVVRHPLQPFSPRYFGAGDDPRLFSYARACADGAQALAGSRQPVPPFFACSLGAAGRPPEVEVEVEVEDLLSFFNHPSRFFLEKRLGMYRRREIEALEDREPARLDNRARGQLGESLLRRALRGENIAVALPSLRASGSLPPGMLGECAYAGLKPAVEAVATAAEEWRQGGPAPPREIDGEIGGTRIVGVLRDLYPAGEVQVRFWRLGSRWELRLWILHLLLNWTAPPSDPRRSVAVGRAPRSDEPLVVQFRPVENAAACLEELLRLYRVGQQIPLPLFPRASRAYAETLLRRPDEERAAERAARSAFAPPPNSAHPGDSSDPFVQRIYGGLDPLDPRLTPPWLCGEVRSAAGVEPVSPALSRSAARSSTQLRVSGSCTAAMNSARPEEAERSEAVSKGERATPLLARSQGPEQEAVGSEFSFGNVARAVFAPLLAHRDTKK